ncbi:cysteine protease rdl2-related [Anaeramoeba ignava]|uniref:Cysteine protease rdl2-related n=1 Tax=Anaeramoeba ignava TaxID=1746090 RepID=A0A9Q0RID8_ANAIG|nr:cysteine protease rdl2-related [Anaeramoeba ignava]
MKVLILILVIVFATCTPYQPMFELFKQKYNKQYTAEEEAYRYRVFSQNVKKMEEHNKKGTFQLGINQFADLTNSEYQSKYLHPIEITRTGSTMKMSNVELPTTVDWRKEGAVTPIKNQGQCGSCWAFSTVGAIEGCVEIASKKLTSLSEQELVDCDSTDDGCNGGLMGNAMDWVAQNGGLCSESAYPYVAYDQSCKKSKCNSVSTITGHVEVTEGSETALATATADKGPISVGIDASNFSFQMYSSGLSVIPVDGSTPYWIVKNSWGTGWGIQGYIWMSKDRNNQCGIATYANYGTGCKSL